MIIPIGPYVAFCALYRGPIGNIEPMHCQALTRKFGSVEEFNDEVKNEPEVFIHSYYWKDDTLFVRYAVISASSYIRVNNYLFDGIM